LSQILNLHDNSCGLFAQVAKLGRRFVVSQLTTVARFD
jgi:hypothetical protein